MQDQAAELRNLVLRVSRDYPVYVGPIPRIIVIRGGKEGVGTTTTSVNLAISLTEQGTRVVLLDGDSHRADVARQCNVQPDCDIQDVRSGRNSIHEAITPGPAGLQIIPGRDATATLEETEAPAGQERLLSQLASLGKHTDSIVCDCGSSDSILNSQLWQLADHAIIVSTPEADSVMATYAAIKSHREALRSETRISVLINQVESESEALDVHQRIDQSCQRFLQQGVSLTGYVPKDVAVLNNSPPSMPVILSRPSCVAALAIDALAARVMKQESEQSRAAA